MPWVQACISFVLLICCDWLAVKAKKSCASSTFWGITQSMHIWFSINDSIHLSSPGHQQLFQSSRVYFFTWTASLEDMPESEEGKKQNWPSYLNEACSLIFPGILLDEPTELLSSRKALCVRRFVNLALRRSWYLISCNMSMTCAAFVWSRSPVQIGK